MSENSIKIYNRTGYLRFFFFPKLSTSLFWSIVLTKELSVHMTNKFESLSVFIVPRTQLLTRFSAEKKRSVDAELTGNVMKMWDSLRSWSNASGNATNCLITSWTDDTCSFLNILAAVWICVFKTIKSSFSKWMGYLEAKLTPGSGSMKISDSVSKQPNAHICQFI